MQNLINLFLLVLQCAQFWRVVNVGHGTMQLITDASFSVRPSSGNVVRARLASSPDVFIMLNGNLFFRMLHD